MKRHLKNTFLGEFKMKQRILLTAMGIVALLLVAGAASADTMKISPSDDTWFASWAPTTNLGTTASLNVGPNANTPVGVTRSALKFDLSAVPAGYRITSATLYLYTGAAPASTTNSYNVYTVSGTDATTWSETTATWNTPQADWTYTLAESSPVSVTAAGWYHWDITAALTQGEIVTLGLKATTETNTTGSSQLINFYSTHSSNNLLHPYLSVTYEEIPEPATAVLLLAGMGLVAKIRKNKTFSK